MSRRFIRFAVVGVVASSASLLVQQAVLGATGSPALAAWIRLASALPILYAGYSRYMLRELLAEDQRRRGFWRAELGMLGRVSVAVGASTVVKAVVEPIAALWLAARLGPQATAASVLLGDYVYGPLVNFLFLTRLGGRAEPHRTDPDTDPDSDTLAPPITTRQVAHLSSPERVVVAAVFGLARVSGWWARPRACEGDVARMGLRDRLHWLYKSCHPVALPPPGEEPPPALPSRVELAGRATDPAECIQLSAIGDLLVPPGESDTDGLYDAIGDDLFGADVSFGNLESPLSASGNRLAFARRGAPRLSMSPTELDALTSHQGRRLTLVSLANNHIGDLGLTGLEVTHRAVVARGMRPIGVAGPGADPTAIVESRGIRIGFFALTFGMNGQDVPPASGWQVDVAALNQASEADEVGLAGQRIDELRTAGCDLVVASLHWGFEYELYPTRRQRGLARSLAARGCDLVLGHHPHVVQPAEIVRDPVSGRRAAVCYSLGNAVHPLFFPANALGLLVRCQIAVKDDAGEARAHIDQLELVPFVQLVFQDGRRQRTRLQPLAQALGRPWRDHASRRFVDQAARLAERVVAESG